MNTIKLTINSRLIQQSFTKAKKKDSIVRYAAHYSLRLNTPQFVCVQTIWCIGGFRDYYGGHEGTCELQTCCVGIKCQNTILSSLRATQQLDNFRKDATSYISVSCPLNKYHIFLTCRHVGISRRDVYNVNVNVNSTKQNVQMCRHNALY